MGSLNPMGPDPLVGTLRAVDFVLQYDDVPPSNNAGGGGARRHWGAAHREKQRWEGVWAMLLLQKRVPRGASFCSVTAELEFTRKARRDVENYRNSLCKPLADVFVKLGIIPDDTNQYFKLDDLTISPERFTSHDRLIKGRTTVRGKAYYAD